MEDRISIARIDELLRFLPLFEVPGRAYIRAWHGGETTPEGATTTFFPEYCDDVLAFFSLAGRTCWSNYAYDPRKAAAMLKDDLFIRTCSLDDIKTMLTYCVRGERFSDGHWASVLESGRIVALLKRLALLKKSFE